MLENVYIALVAAAPSITAIATIIIGAVKIMKEFKALKNEVISAKEYTEVKRELAAAHRENAELKKQMNEVLTKIDRIKRD